MASVCIVVEHGKGKLKRATLNSLTFGRKAAEALGAKLCLVVVGNDVSGIADELKGYGAEKILVAEDPGLEHYTAETWGHVVAEAARELDAKIVGMSSGTTGKDLMPRVAAKLGAGMASSVLSFDGQDFTREMWAGSVIARVEVKTDIKVVTIQGTHFAPAEPDGSETVIEPLQVTLPETKTRFVEMQEAKSERPDLTEARFIISGGRGMAAAEHFSMLEEVTDLYGGAVGATRAAVDAVWVSNDLQVGQTGKKVAPDLYIAVGLSGSIQHMAGMKNSKVIVAINKDEDAPIFDIADFGLVADLFKAVPELLETLKAETS
jgi:electron transfer flavoprotein alpha subunit